MKRRDLKTIETQDILNQISGYGHGSGSGSGYRSGSCSSGSDSVIGYDDGTSVAGSFGSSVGVDRNQNNDGAAGAGSCSRAIDGREEDRGESPNKMPRLYFSSALNARGIEVNEGNSLVLSFSNGKIGSLPHFQSDQLSRIVEFDLCGNFIQKIDFNAFECFTNIKVLDFGANKLKYIPNALRNLTSLQELKLNNNLLTSISGEPLEDDQQNGNYKPENVLDKLISLQNLDLKSNQITVVDNLRHLTGLKKLSLSCNHITVINKEGLPNSLPELESLGFFGNTSYTKSEQGLNEFLNVWSAIAPNLKELILNETFTIYGDSKKIEEFALYRAKVIKAFPKLEWLDSQCVSTK